MAGLVLGIALFAASWGGGSAADGGAERALYLDPTATPAARASDLLARMTVRCFFSPAANHPLTWKIRSRPAPKPPSFYLSYV